MKTNVPKDASLAVLQALQATGEYTDAAAARLQARITELTLTEDLPVGTLRVTAHEDDSGLPGAMLILRTGEEATLTIRFGWAEARQIAAALQNGVKRPLTLLPTTVAEPRGLWS